MSGFVVEDDRRFNRSLDRDIQLGGTTLNGASFAGLTIEVRRSSRRSTG